MPDRFCVQTENDVKTRDILLWFMCHDCKRAALSRVGQFDWDMSADRAMLADSTLRATMVSLAATGCPHMPEQFRRQILPSAEGLE